MIVRDQDGQILSKGDEFRYALKDGVLAKGIVTEVPQVLAANQQQQMPYVKVLVELVLISPTPAGNIFGLIKTGEAPKAVVQS